MQIRRSRRSPYRDIARLWQIVARVRAL